MRAASPYAPFVASALIIAGFVALYLLMPRIMLAVSGGGPVAGALVAILFMLAIFAVLWLRARRQRRFHKD